jgi:hypothetical protein
MMISGHQLCTWLPLIAVALPAIRAIVRYSVLLAGLIVTLPRSVKADRPEIFREFARAMAISRHNNSGSDASSYVRELARAVRGRGERSLCYVVIRLDAVLAQNRPQPPEFGVRSSQFGVQSIQFPGHGQSA